MPLSPHRHLPRAHRLQRLRRYCTVTGCRRLVAGRSLPHCHLHSRAIPRAPLPASAAQSAQGLIFQRSLEMTAHDALPAVIRQWYLTHDLPFTALLAQGLLAQPLTEAEVLTRLDEIYDSYRLAASRKAPHAQT